jgi:DNA-binding MarR family transcriptional regulator
MQDYLRLEQQLCFALYAATRAMTQAYAPLLEPLGLTYPQYLVMLVLWEVDGAALGAVGERLHLDSGTLTPLAKRLEAQGLVERRRDADDERVVRLHLTRTGRALRKRAADIPRAMACQAALPLGELARLRGELLRLTQTLRATGAPAPEEPAT